MPASLLVCAIGQYRQALGDSRTAMRATLVANLVHVPLNFALIFGAELGVAGAAWASVICTLVEAAILVRAQGLLGFGWRHGSWRSALQTFRFGLPAAFERWLDVGAFAALVVLIAKAGPTQLAAHQITLQILHFCFLPVMALSDAVCVLVAQAVGAREPAIARRVVGYGLKTGLVFGALCGAVLLYSGKFLLGFFTSDATLIAAAFRVVQVAVLLQLINAVFLVLKGALRGFGALRYVAWVTVGCAWLFTPPLTWLFTYWLGLGAAGGWLALTVEVCVGSTLVFWRLRRSALQEPDVAAVPAAPTSPALHTATARPA
jgi:putative MATE family efflux protein